MDRTPTLIDRCRGALLGLACGDAVGTTVEFSPRGSFEPLTDMVGGGPFELPVGAWTDDTSMALCLATSLIERKGFDPRDQMNRYTNWWQWGYLSSTGDCFDIGMTVSAALQRYAASGDPFAGSKATNTAGNGSLMRLAPVALAYFPDRAEVRRHAALSSATTHAAAEALSCCELFAELLCRALGGADKDGLLQIEGFIGPSDRVTEIGSAAYLNKAEGQIRGTGYCVDSLEAALWAFGQTESFREAVLLASNLGDDADTTAAITGQLAGAFYGVQSIPPHWLERLVMASEIDQLAQALHGLQGQMAHHAPT